MHLQRLMMFLAVSSMTAPPAAAQDASQTVTVTLTDYAFTPGVIVLKANTPAHLHLVNGAGKSHSFSAPEFFAASTLAPEDLAKVKHGTIDLDGGRSLDLTVTP